MIPSSIYVNFIIPERELKRRKEEESHMDTRKQQYAKHMTNYRCHHEQQ